MQGCYGLTAHGQIALFDLPAEITYDPVGFIRW